MTVEKLKYTIWAANTKRATQFYTDCFQAKLVRQTPHITELAIANGLIAIHDGGDGQRTWTGITLQVANVESAAAEVVANGGSCERPPQWEDGEPPHLAMCQDTEGNQIMLSRQRD